MPQLVAAGGGVSDLPEWIVHEEGKSLSLRAMRPGPGSARGLHIGLRKGAENIDYIAGFLAIAHESGAQPVPE